jgi:hypothetical protein
MEPECSFLSWQESKSKPRAMCYYMLVVNPLPNAKLQDHPLSAVCDCLWSILLVLYLTGEQIIFLNRRAIMYKQP